MKKTNLVKKFTALSAIGAGLVITLVSPSQVKADNGYLMTQEQIEKNLVQKVMYMYLNVIIGLKEEKEQ